MLVGFCRLTALETALLMSAALVVVSLTPHQWTLKNKLSQHTTHLFSSKSTRNQYACTESVYFKSARMF